MSEKLKVGDVVTLKSGGSPMTITQVISDGGGNSLYECSCFINDTVAFGFSTTQVFRRFNFAAESLRKVDDGTQRPLFG